MSFRFLFECDYTQLEVLDIKFFAGIYNVILNEPHFRDILLQHCRPPPAKVGGSDQPWCSFTVSGFVLFLQENSEATLIRMGKGGDVVQKGVGN